MSIWAIRIEMYSQLQSPNKTNSLKIKNITEGMNCINGLCGGNKKRLGDNLAKRFSVPT